MKQRESDVTKRRPFKVKIRRAVARFEVWLCPGGDSPHFAGAIDAKLAADAKCHGQDLVEELVEQTLKWAESCR